MPVKPRTAVIIVTQLVDVSCRPIKGKVMLEAFFGTYIFMYILLNDYQIADRGLVAVREVLTGPGLSNIELKADHIAQDI
jgi:hypothetical protein